MKRFERGLVVGKLAPLHRGHELVINRAIAECDEVIVISYSRPELRGCEPDRRELWLAGRFPEVTRLIVSERGVSVNGKLAELSLEIPNNDDAATPHRQFCARLCLDVLKNSIDAVFSSEGYGDGFAGELTKAFRAVNENGQAVVQVPVDPDRRQVPVSGTALRSNIHGLREFLSPEVYATFVKRVCLLGGESTGKSTLTAALARTHSTTHVEEYGRTLWEEKGGHLVFDDLLAIAKRQIALEEEAAQRAVRHLFCDTSPLTTLFYSHEMFGKADPALVALAERPYDHVFLCAPDFDFVQDGTRRERDFREHGHQWYVNELARRGIDYITLTGNLEERSERVGQLLGTI